MNWGGAFLEKGPSPLPKPHPLLSKDFHQMGRPRHRSSFRREIVGTAGKVTVPPEKRARAAL